MATITPVVVDIAGEAETFVAASAGGDTIATAGHPTDFIVTNGSASPITVTFTGVVSCSQGSLHNVAITIPATSTKATTVPAQAVNPANGNAAVTYSAVTSVTVAATQ